MERVVGTVARGLRCPIINRGDNIEEIVVDSVLKASEVEGFTFNDKDIVSITESIVARAQGNYATIDHIAKDVSSKFGEDTVGVIFPILSRNRFAICLRGIAKGAKKIVLMLSYPSDEVGNHLVDLDMLDEKGINPWTDVLTEKQFRDHFGYNKHTFTGVDYIDYYKSLVEEYGVECEVIFSNNPKTILDYTKNVLTCDIHTRFRTKKILKANGGKKFIASMTYYLSLLMAVDIMKLMVCLDQINQQKMVLNFSHVIANLSLIIYNICSKKRRVKILKS